ncbi:hypothetical protein MHBO_002528, partial [Bonamia ostreae]
MFLFVARQIMSDYRNNLFIIFLRFHKFQGLRKSDFLARYIFVGMADDLFSNDYPFYKHSNLPGTTNPPNSDFFVSKRRFCQIKKELAKNQNTIIQLPFVRLITD